MAFTLSGAKAITASPPVCGADVLVVLLLRMCCGGRRQRGTPLKELASRPKKNTK
jgi:hypothetical protein